MSPKATIIILWACIIAGAAVASEKHRTTIEYQEYAIELHGTIDPHMRLEQKCNSSMRLT